MTVYHVLRRRAFGRYPHTVDAPGTLISILTLAKCSFSKTAALSIVLILIYFTFFVEPKLILN